MSGPSEAVLRAKQRDRAMFTVDAIGGILIMLSRADHGDSGHLPVVHLWLGERLADAGIVLAGGGE